MIVGKRTLRLIELLLVLLSFTTARSDEQLRRKIAQMIMIGFDGTTLPESVRVDLATRNLGGVILLGRNCTSPLQIQQLTTAIRANARTAPFIAVDQEGGVVARLNRTNGFDSTHSPYTLGTTYNVLDSTTRQAVRMAGWLRAGGFTTTLAPVVDVNVNPQSPAIGRHGRSFSRNPRAVAQHAQSFIDGFHSQGIITATKHFPGHGSAGTDSHLQLPDITQTWADSELVPYRSLIMAGTVDMVMIGHLYNAHLDSVYPTSLSVKTIAGLLRDSLDYDGVVISDDLYAMRAITDRYSYGKAAELAINAGTDILLYVWNTLRGGSLLRQMIDTIETNVQSSVIAESRIDVAYARIQQLKARYGLNSIPFATSLPQRVQLYQNYPNPFNPTTKIRFQIPVQRTPYGEASRQRRASPEAGGQRSVEDPTRLEVSRVTLKVFDVLGREVATLVREHLNPGEYSVEWNAANFPSGVYFARLESGQVSLSRKLLLLR